MSATEKVHILAIIQGGEPIRCWDGAYSGGFVDVDVLSEMIYDDETLEMETRGDVRFAVERVK